MIYLDNAATTMQKPRQVYEAVWDAMHQCASVGRSGHEAAVRAAQVAFECRVAAAELLDAEPEQIVFTSNATHALNIAIHSCVSPGDRVVISSYEHNAVWRPLHAIGAELEIIAAAPFADDLFLEQMEKALTPETKAVVCTHVSNVFGNILPIEKVAEQCNARNIPLIVDASQSAGILPLSLKKLHAAFLAMPGHKGLYGPQGTGILVCGRMPKPLLYGGTGSLSLSPEMPDFLPDRAESGTHNVPGIAGLLAGIRYLHARGIDAIKKKERTLMQCFYRGISEIPGVNTIYSERGEHQVGVLSLCHPAMVSEVVAAKLAQQQIAVRAGLHCAPLAHQTVGTAPEGTVRFSVSDFNTSEEMDTAVSTLCRIFSDESL